MQAYTVWSIVWAFEAIVQLSDVMRQRYDDKTKIC